MTESPSDPSDDAGPLPGAAPESTLRAGVPLQQILLAVGDPLMEVLAAPAGLDVRVDNIALVDPEDDVGADPGDLALLIGARGGEARRLVRTAAHQGAAAVAVKAGAASGPDTAALRAAASEAGIALLGVRPAVRWDQLQALCRSVVDDARFAGGADLGDAAGDLFSLAQTIAALTGGLVSIEDSASRVLAYSSGDEVDELRRLSVLGRQGPPAYLALLREWGVFARLRSGDEVVHIDEHPELGIRRRIAVGIRAGDQPLGAIWVQEGTGPFADGAEEAMLGAARLTALHLLRQRTAATAGQRLREDLLAGLLEGRIEPAALGDAVAVGPDRPALVAAFALAPGRSDEPNRSGLELMRRRMIDLVAVHTAAYRRSALVTALGTRVYVLLPDLPGQPHAADRSGSAEAAVLALSRKAVEAARTLLGVAVHGAVGSPVAASADITRSRSEADRVLDALGRDVELDVATIADVRSRVLVGETLAHLRRTPSLRDPRVAELVRHDARGGAELVPSLLAYLEAFGEVRTAAERLHIHPNTLRYRVRRAEAVSGLDLSQPDQRLFTHLQLLMEGSA
ncbi:PucR family transcriptional regulator [Nocardiopsis coralliicola]